MRISSRAARLIRAGVRQARADHALIVAAVVLNRPIGHDSFAETFGRFAKTVGPTMSRRDAGSPLTHVAYIETFSRLADRRRARATRPRTSRAFQSSEQFQFDAGDVR